MEDLAADDTLDLGLSPREDEKAQEDPLKQVKKHARPDWINSENKIFINKLNFICDNYDRNHQEVKRLKACVYKTHKVEIEDLKVRLREFKDDYIVNKSRVEKIEEKLPLMIREMINYYCEQRFEQRFEDYLLIEDFKKQISYKMDTSMFREYTKKQIEKESMKNSDFQIAERFNKFEKSLRGLINSNQLSTALKQKVNVDKFTEVRDTLSRVSTKAEESSSSLSKKLEYFEEEVAQRVNNLNEVISSLQIKVKELSDELRSSQSSQSEVHPAPPLDLPPLTPTKVLSSPKDSKKPTATTPGLKVDSSIESSIEKSKLSKEEEKEAQSIEQPKDKDESLEIGGENQTGFCLEKKEETDATPKGADPLIVKMGSVEGTVSADDKNPNSLKVERQLLSTSRVKVPLEGEKPKKKEKIILIKNQDEEPDPAKEPIKKNDTLMIDPAKFNLNVQEQNSLNSIANSSLYIDVKKTIDSNGPARKPQLSEIDSPNSVHKSKRSRRGKSRRDMPQASDEASFQMNLDRTGDENYPRAELFALSDENKKLQIEINQMKQEIMGVQEQNHHVLSEMNKLEERIKETLSFEPEQILDKITRKLVSDVLREKVTPIRTAFNVETKSLKKLIEDCMSSVRDHRDRQVGFEKQLDQINLNILRQLKNTDKENKLLDRELNRMQKIDRVKVAQARTSFFNPETQSLLPTLDTLIAASFNQQQSPSLTMNSVSMDQQQLSQEQREIITTNEMTNRCERLGAKPSERSRIIITRSQERHSRGGKAFNSVQQPRSNVFQGNNQRPGAFGTAPHDSIMSNRNPSSIMRDAPGTAPGTNPFHQLTSPANRSNRSRSNKKIGSSPIQLNQFGYIDIQNPDKPMDFQSRLKIKANEKFREDVAKKKKLAKQLEVERARVLQSYNIKTTI